MLRHNKKVREIDRENIDLVLVIRSEGVRRRREATAKGASRQRAVKAAVGCERRQELEGPVASNKARAQPPGFIYLTINDGVLEDICGVIYSDGQWGRPKETRHGFIKTYLKIARRPQPHPYPSLSYLSSLALPFAASPVSPKRPCHDTDQ
ncbi:hypothetical protein E2C01_035777 [Portunus trituberculatus]|uniref:Uncharacterized protein n=1 Tax=Portunus trituberculatus TaxID=210409 RepID=A0A5B7FAM8_PORTR|nr:hypothetical protein [Portunus trituberculatus]